MSESESRKSSRIRKQTVLFNPNQSTLNRKRKTVLTNTIQNSTSSSPSSATTSKKQPEKRSTSVKLLREALESRRRDLTEDEKETNRMLFYFFKSYFEGLNNTIHNRFMNNYKTICSTFATLHDDSTGIQNLGCALRKITDPTTKFSKFVDQFNALKIENESNDLIDYFDLEVCDQISKGVIKIPGLACKHADMLTVDMATTKVKNAVSELTSFKENKLTNVLALEKTQQFLNDLERIDSIEIPIDKYNKLSDLIKKYVDDLKKIIADLQTVKEYDRTNPNIPERDIDHVMNSFKCYLSRLRYNVSPCQKFRMYVNYLSNLKSQNKLKESLTVLYDHNNDISKLIEQLFVAKIEELKNSENEYHLTDIEKKNLLPVEYEKLESMITPLVIEDIDNFSKFYDENRCEIVGGGKRKAKKTSSILKKVTKYIKQLLKKK